MHLKASSSTIPQVVDSWHWYLLGGTIPDHLVLLGRCLSVFRILLVESLSSLVYWFENLCRDLPPELLDLEFIDPVFLILFLDLLSDFSKLGLKCLDRFFLTLDLFPQFLLFDDFLLLRHAEVIL